ncbi:uncharacterized protein K444DRAFT_635636 [Hyaloscypha bicolor E]|uniref:Extracellular membrane protein CFEM domain-containing protein n=1 Tax=Hyaloscypha bicolor E TaxID=1095630 RepID=A0A2J6SPG1_9HELO|nr:uncharacterized protein K444DRAFT_635636 [Hyaloscypha bicolor E]PMD52668.1 hypothetical protein K444DRAFT_635636 [Hyaloscypha bicolor E]
MRVSEALLWASAAVAIVSAVALEAAVVTPAPVPPYHEALRRYRTGREPFKNIKERDELDNLGFCWGGLDQVTVCDTSVKLSDECSSFQTADDWGAYWKCLCENGGISAQQQCDWCEAAYSIDTISGYMDMATSECSSYSASIAPVPASYLALASSYNATYSGFSTTPAKTGTGRGSSPTSSASGKKTGPTSSHASTTSVRTFGGGGAAPTLAVPNTQVQSSPTPTGGVRTGAAQGWRDSAVSSFVVVTFGLTALCLL